MVRAASKLPYSRKVSAAFVDPLNSAKSPGLHSFLGGVKHGDYLRYFSKAEVGCEYA